MCVGLKYWKRAFPMGCPTDKLQYFIDEQTKIDERVNPYALLGEVRGGDVVEWDMLVDKLKQIREVENMERLRRLQESGTTLSARNEDNLEADSGSREYGTIAKTSRKRNNIKCAER